MKFRKNSESNENTIDISPLMDVTFLLLIFFMVSSTFSKDMQVDISRPGASQVQPSDSKSIRVFIDKEGSVYIDGQLTRSWVVQSKVREMIAQGASSSVLVVTDRSVSAERLIEIVDQCRQGGALDVGVAAEHET